MLRLAGGAEVDRLNASAYSVLLGAVSAATVGPSWPAAATATRWAGCCWRQG
jgi:hypothetical protein